MTPKKTTKAGGASRRDFLRTAAGTAVAANLALAANVHAAGSDVIKIGIIGCGGRGTGAIDNALASAENLKLVAMGDAFQDHLDECFRRASATNRDKVDVPKDRQFVGLDAYQKVLACDINYVILATPPGFRPLHLEAAVAAGKHIFTEKPVGVDGPGIRRVLNAYEESKKKGLCVVAGTQRRHQTGYLETMKRIHDGAIGDIVAARCYWNGNYVWDPHTRQKGWSDLETQMRNWYYYLWLCGDHIVEQHVHNLDVINWALGTHPASAVGMGGRANRTDPKFGHIYDHFAVDYEYPKDAAALNGNASQSATIHVMSQCRQVPQGKGCENNISEGLAGSRGFCFTDGGNYRITDLHGRRVWALERGKDNEPYVQEHADLIECIRAGKPVNELRNVAESTLTAVLGRMAAYTGKRVTWDQALNSKEELMPNLDKLTWETPVENRPVPVPGTTPLV